MMDYLEAGARAQEAGEDTSQYAAAFRRSFIAAEAGLKEAIAFQPDEYDNYVALADLYNTAGGGPRRALLRRGHQCRSARGWSSRRTARLSGCAWPAPISRRGARPRPCKELEYVVRLDPRDGEAALALAGVYAQQKRFEEALAVLRAVEAVAPGQPGVADAIAKLEKAGAAPAQ